MRTNARNIRKPARASMIGALLLGLSTPVAAVAATGALPIAPSSAPRVFQVTEQDAGKTFHVARGTRIDVALHGSYDQPTTDRTDVLRSDSRSGGYPTASDARAMFTAVSSGSAALASRIDMACMHTNPRCMIMTAPLQVNFVVDPAPRPAGTMRIVGESDNHRTITMRKGQSLRLLLHSTYWTIRDPHGHALTASAAQVTTPAAGCVPGRGCGTALRDFRASRLGVAHLQAARTSCGEAMRCTGGSGAWSLTVLVVG